LSAEQTPSGVQPSSAEEEPQLPEHGEITKRRNDARKIGVARTENGDWELAHPRCARLRYEDIREVEGMIAAGETEIAQDELRWLLSECHDFLIAHKLLGDLALAGGDVKLARGHFGYAYQIGVQAINRAKIVGTLPADRAANQEFFAAGRGLAICMIKLGKHGLAKDVIERLLQFDPRDLLRLQELLPSEKQNQRRGKDRR
jgi:tetratricopeptide (TPR) repeat protein